MGDESWKLHAQNSLQTLQAVALKRASSPQKLFSFLITQEVGRDLWILQFPELPEYCKFFEIPRPYEFFSSLQEGMFQFRVTSHNWFTKSSIRLVTWVKNMERSKYFPNSFSFQYFLYLDFPHFKNFHRYVDVILLHWQISHIASYILSCCIIKIFCS